eukprot:TRINITY_DN7287_c0_g2_i1.p2 TRINITY_DN7287_c0_g2~~TRINITY_DN7287_c0_g2_i1.p2  ORF type:complete len:134 (+),score=5.08 TRINITY_DN7287_c0_g2_i1:53-454(+)
MDPGRAKIVNRVLHVLMGVVGIAMFVAWILQMYVSQALTHKTHNFDTQKDITSILNYTYSYSTQLSPIVSIRFSSSKGNCSHDYRPVSIYELPSTVACCFCNSISSRVIADSTSNSSVSLLIHLGATIIGPTT